MHLDLAAVGTHITEALSVMSKTTSFETKWTDFCIIISCFKFTIIIITDKKKKLRKGKMITYVAPTAYACTG